MMEKITYRIGSKKTIIVKNGQTYHIVVLKKIVGYYIEIPDVLFNHNSAVPCLDKENYLISAIGSTHAFHEKHKDKYVIIVGHADRSGKIAYNYQISDYRAKSVKAILDRDEQLWQEVVEKYSRVMDYQQILLTLAEIHGWDCHPGSVDDIDGSATKSGVSKFQKIVNSRYSVGLTVDGIMGPKTWNAVFRVYCELSKSYDGTSTEPYLYGLDGKGTYSCGESFPEEKPHIDSYKSQENRRVEIYFFKPESQPTLLPPVSEEQLLTFNECNLLNPEEVELINVPLSSKAVTAEYLKIGLINPYSYDSTTEMHLVLTGSHNNEKTILGELDDFGYWVFIIQEYEKDDLYDLSLKCSTDGQKSLCFEKFNLHRYHEMLKSGEIDDSALPSNLITDWKIVEDPLEDGESVDRTGENGEMPPLARA